MSVLFGFLPVILFMGCLFLLDSFKLIKTYLLFYCIAWGIVSALLSFYLNTIMMTRFGISFLILSRYMAPFIEEGFKVLLLLVLIYRKQIGFAIDAAIYGFAIGTGFFLAENLYYFIQMGESYDLTLAIIRGFGTAVMHCGTIAICAIILMGGDQITNMVTKYFFIGLLSAIILHSAFNHFILNPLLQTLLIITILPAVFYLIFSISTKNLRQWLEVEFINEVEMLRMLRFGKFSNTRSGKYLVSLKSFFTAENLVDMYCFLSLYLELSIKAKRNLLLRETGFKAIIEPDINNKLIELKQLRKNIGKSGEMALLPLVRMNYRDLWKLNQFKN
jgi:protease PrsW